MSTFEKIFLIAFAGFCLLVLRPNPNLWAKQSTYKTDTDLTDSIAISLLQAQNKALQHEIDSLAAMQHDYQLDVYMRDYTLYQDGRLIGKLTPSEIGKIDSLIIDDNQ